MKYLAKKDIPRIKQKLKEARRLMNYERNMIVPIKPIIIPSLYVPGKIKR